MGRESLRVCGPRAALIIGNGPCRDNVSRALGADRTARCGNHTVALRRAAADTLGRHTEGGRKLGDGAALGRRTPRLDVDDGQLDLSRFRGFPFRAVLAERHYNLVRSAQAT